MVKETPKLILRGPLQGSLKPPLHPGNMLARGLRSFSDGQGEKCSMHTEKCFRNLIESNQNQIVFTCTDFLEQQTDTVHLLFQINQKMVNTI